MKTRPLIGESIENNRSIQNAGRDTDIRAHLPGVTEALYRVVQEQGYSREQAAELLAGADKQTLVDLTTAAAAAIAKDEAIKDYWLKRI
jgi:hypothetical protein